MNCYWYSTDLIKVYWTNLAEYMLKSGTTSCRQKEYWKNYTRVLSEFTLLTRESYFFVALYYLILFLWIFLSELPSTPSERFPFEMWGASCFIIARNNNFMQFTCITKNLDFKPQE